MPAMYPTFSQSRLPIRLPIKMKKGSCAWCGDPGEVEIILEPDRYGFKDQMLEDGTTKRVKYLRKRAIKAWVCKNHRKTLKYREDYRPGKAEASGE